MSAPPDPTPRLDPRALGLEDPAVAHVFGALEAAAAGPGARPRFVGGCVRDALLGRAAADLDLATPMAPEAVTAALERAGVKVVPTGLAHGTVTAVFGGRAIEITTLRVDVETDGRRAKIAYTDDWRADAARRDFTMNALSAGRDGRIHDYFGGVADARAGRVRFIGAALQRIDEDALRILRFFRFQAWFGRGAPDPEGLAACAARRGAIDGLAGERIRHEILRLLAAPDPVPAWRAMADCGAASAALGRDGRIDRLARLVGLGLAPDPVLRLAVLLVPDVGPALARLKPSRAETRRIEALATAGPLDLGEGPGEGPGERPGEGAALRAAIYREGPRLVGDRLILAAAEGRGMAALARRLAAIEGWPVPVLPVRGRDAAALGLRGPAVGAALAAVEDWWIAQDFGPDRAACLARLAIAAGG